MTIAPEDRILDWEPSTHRDTNADHRMATLDCYAGGTARSTISRTLTVHLDQGREGACTGFGLAHALAATPAAQLPMTEAEAHRLYRQAQREDEWEGEDYDGSSVNGAMHAGRTLGRVKAWRWCATPEEVRHALSYHGAVEAGSEWLTGMFHPDADGYLRVEGSVAGGHAYAVRGYRLAPWRGPGAIDYRVPNSWGLDWGQGGEAWLRDTDAHRLWFTGWGEVACPVKLAQV